MVSSGGEPMKLVNFNVPVSSDWLITNQRRLDSGPYLGGAYEARAVLEKLPKDVLKALKTLTRGYDNQKDDYKQGIFNGPRFPRAYVDNPEYGIPFLGSTDILAADLSRLPLLSKEQVRLEPQLVIDQGWTLITCSGTIGRMAYARADMQGMAGSQHFMRVVPDTNIIPSGYLYSYLSSKYGVPLVVSGTYGAIIQHIEPHHIADLPVPRLGDSVEAEADRLMRETATLRTAYQSKVQQATDLLFESVGLRDITPAEWHAQGPDLGFVHQLAEWSSLRALNFNPRLQRLYARIKQGPWCTLNSLCEAHTLQRGGRYKRIDADEGYGVQLVGQRQLFWQRPEGRRVSATSLGDDVFVDPGTTLIAAQGTLGEGEMFCRAEFIWGPGTELAYSEHMLRVAADETLMLRGCLFAFLRSETAFRMLRSISVGSKQQDQHYALLPNLPIPYPSREIQREVHTLIVEAYDGRHRSNLIEDQAVNLVEHAIERAIVEAL
jgi:hypothetical protein